MYMVGSTALFVTCLVDEFFPRVGTAAVRLLEQAGCRVAFPDAQTCCGQPAFNMGYRDQVLPLARRWIAAFEGYDEVVAPSGSCAAMVRVQYPRLFAEAAEPEWEGRARRLADRVFELTEYLAGKDFAPRPTGCTAACVGKVTCHDSCHLRRELGVVHQPRTLLRQVPGLELVEMADSDRCCGFGGAFAVKMAELSGAMMERKLQAAEATGADVLTATDCGCLMHLGGALTRRRSPLRVLHVAEILAGEIQAGED
jgi:L-lactate dehydrogenase complex protein LldE